MPSTPAYVLLVAAAVVAGIARAILDGRAPWARLFAWSGRVETAAITTLLLILTGLGVVQIVLRNFFHTGLIWADPVMRHLVLWLGCFGASLATAHGRHINIDVFGRLLPAGMQRYRRIVVHGAAGVAASFLCIATLRLVADERAFGDFAFLGVHTWVVQLVLPLTFFTITMRSVTNAIIDRDEPAGGDAS